MHPNFHGKCNFKVPSSICLIIGWDATFKMSIAFFSVTCVQTDRVHNCLCCNFTSRK